MHKFSLRLLYKMIIMWFSCKGTFNDFIKKKKLPIPERKPWCQNFLRKREREKRKIKGWVTYIRIIVYIPLTKPRTTSKILFFFTKRERVSLLQTPPLFFFSLLLWLGLSILYGCVWEILLPKNQRNEEHAEFFSLFEPALTKVQNGRDTHTQRGEVEFLKGGGEKARVGCFVSFKGNWKFFFLGQEKK